ncbi:hypothetical protein [Salinadaptatus halalkaliphilus]|uniref:hypothetical protein n=1 Tax=Salinadaptatus halalkaliphilus TaxID=2419781 RepID=UPI001580163A|nr:hypothetical protein [Salinadaptatus halalkaliphilus]
MNRALGLCVGLIWVVVPGRIVEMAERFAFENPDDGQLRRITLPIARLEGLAFCGLVLRGGLPKPLQAPFALLGILLATVPRRMLAAGLAIAYENPLDLEAKPWLLPATRVIGVLYVVLGLAPGLVDAPTDDHDHVDEPATPD